MMTLTSDQLVYHPAELARHSKVPLEILPDAEAVYRHFARELSGEIRSRNAAGQPTRVILPVGPVAQYPLLAEICNRERISWRSVSTFNMDEYCDWQGRAIPVEHPLSFRGFMQRELFERLDPDLRPPAGQLHFPDPLNLDAISAAIHSAGGVDTCYGGVGYHGHVAFNEPPVSRWYRPTLAQFRDSLTRLVPLAPETVVMNTIRNSGGNSAGFPPMGVTLGMADLRAARRIRLYLPGGAWQRYALRVACLGEPDVDYPVTLLQDHPDILLVTDLETAAPPGMAL